MVAITEVAIILENNQILREDWEQDWFKGVVEPRYPKDME